MDPLQDPDQLLQSPLSKLYEWERTRPDEVYMRQPIDGQMHTWTWREVGDEVRRMAAVLKAMDLPEGSKVALLSKNCAHWIMADLAIFFDTLKLTDAMVVHDPVRFACRHDTLIVNRWSKGAG